MYKHLIRLKDGLNSRWFSINRCVFAPRERDYRDVLVVGAGPAGLSAAIRIKQLAIKEKTEIRVCVLEKGGDMGSHILSGAVLEPRALSELFPDWEERGAPLEVPVKKDYMRFLTKSSAIPLPLLPQMRNKGNYIVSLSHVVKWLGAQAEQLGVELYPGFGGKEILYDETGRSVKGVATNDVGLDKHGIPKHNFQRGFELHAPITLLAEGCHGSLTKELIERFHMRRDSQPQTYGIGLKEIWQIEANRHELGTVYHTLGWPLDRHIYGGTFIYHWKPHLVSIGMVIGLDYRNPYLNPYMEFQRFKHHPFVRRFLEGGTCIAYGARALNEGGYQVREALRVLPQLCFKIIQEIE